MHGNFFEIIHQKTLKTLSIKIQQILLIPIQLLQLQMKIEKENLMVNMKEALKFDFDSVYFGCGQGCDKNHNFSAVKKY